MNLMARPRLGGGKSGIFSALQLFRLINLIDGTTINF
jgi:hypothetical protein